MKELNEMVTCILWSVDTTVLIFTLSVKIIVDMQTRDLPMK